MATSTSDSDDINARPPDPFVAARHRDPAEAPVPTVTLRGLLGDSDREGRRRLYLTTRLDYYAEFATEDVVEVADIPADQPPFRGLDATRVALRHGARVDYVSSRIAGPEDEFDLDVRRVHPARGRMTAADPQVLPPFEQTFFVCPWSAVTVCKIDGCADPVTGACTVVVTCAGTCRDTCGPTCGGSCGGTCGDVSCDGTCRGETCQGTCFGTCGEGTCFGTCGEATCGQHTCGTCGGATCDRQTCGTCGEATCVGQTCFGTCGRATCFGTCGEATCEGQTCQGTCGRQTCLGTCGGLTCDGTCNASCPDSTCAGTCGFCDPTVGPEPCFLSQQC